MTIYAIRALRRFRQRIGRLRQAAGPRRRVHVAHATPFAAVAASLAMTACSWTAHDVHADGIVWQLDNATINPAGNWQQLGVHELLIQWSAVDDTAYLAGTGMRTAAHLPDWQRIGREPWARNVILGLAGYQDERRARTQLSALADQAVAVARAPVPLHVTGYYFPVEIDPAMAGRAEARGDPEPVAATAVGERVRPEQHRREGAGRLARHVAARGCRCVVSGRLRRVCARTVCRAYVRR